MKELFKLWDSEDKKVIEVEAKKVGKEWRAFCPKHEDRKTPNLYINKEKGVFLCRVPTCKWTGPVYDPAKVFISKPKRKPRKKAPEPVAIATYDYQDEQGKLLYQVLKYRDKSFPQRQPDGKGSWIYNTEGVKRVLYRLPELLKAENTVYVVEGEKDTDNLLGLGLSATTNPMGAGKWRSEYNQYLKHFKTVVLLPDNDQQGQLHIRAVGNSLLEDDFKDIRLLDLPGLAEGEDITDWLKKDGNDQDLLLLYTKEAPIFNPFDITLEQVLSIFGKWLVLDETVYIETVLATVVSNLIPGDPVWLFLTGQSGGSKTEVLRALFDSPLIYAVSKFTAHTLISGKRLKGHPDPSLLPLLHNKTLIIKDFSCILEMPRDDRAQIFADLRDAYDGEASKKLGLEQKIYKYKSHFSLIAGTTGAIDAFTAVNQALGERFLKIRLPKSSDDLAKTKKALDNVDEQEQMREELGAISVSFLSQPFRPSQVTISQDIKRQLALLANFVGKCRTSVSRDPYQQGVIRFPPEPELGTRLGVQFAKLSKSLAAIRAKLEVSQAELDVIRGIALDTIPKKVLLVIKVLYEGGNLLKTSEIGNKTKIGPKTALLALHDLEALEIVESEKATYERGSPWCWSLAENFTQSLEELTIWPVPKSKQNDLQRRMKI